MSCASWCSAFRDSFRAPAGDGAWLTPDAAADTTLYHVEVPWTTPWRRDLPGALRAVVLRLSASAGPSAHLALSVRHGAIFSQLAVPLAVALWH